MRRFLERQCVVRANISALLVLLQIGGLGDHKCRRCLYRPLVEPQYVRWLPFSCGSCSSKIPIWCAPVVCCPVDLSYLHLSPDGDADSDADIPVRASAKRVSKKTPLPRVASLPGVCANGPSCICMGWEHNGRWTGVCTLLLSCPLLLGSSILS